MTVHRTMQTSETVQAGAWRVEIRCDQDGEAPKQVEIARFQSHQHLSVSRNDAKDLRDVLLVAIAALQRMAEAHGKDQNAIRAWVKPLEVNEVEFKKP